MNATVAAPAGPGADNPGIERLLGELRKYLVVKSSDLIDRVGQTMESTVSQLAAESEELGVFGQAGMAGITKLAEGESFQKAAWSFVVAAIRAQLRSMFGPDRTFGQKVLNVLLLLIAVLTAIVVLVLLIVLVPVALLIRAALRRT